MALPNSVCCKEVEFEKILLINADVLEILVGKSIRGNKKLELRLSITLFIESEFWMTLFAISVLKYK